MYRGVKAKLEALSWHMAHSLHAFIGLVAVLLAIPGPAVTLIMKNAALRGPSVALLTAPGVFTADLVWVLASVLGITSLLVASRSGFELVRLLGAIYLIYLSLLAYTVVFAGTRRAVTGPRLKKVLLRSTGGVLIAFGVSLVGVQR
jgi:threonine/homoserine/homoserine lactone efflux protein